MKPEFVRRTMDLEPHVGADFVITDQAARGRRKNFRSTARERTEPGILELFQNLPH